MSGPAWLVVHRDRHTGRWANPRVVDAAVADAYSRAQQRLGVRTLAVDLDDLETRLSATS